jgi:hypothetical protein
MANVIESVKFLQHSETASNAIVVEKGENNQITMIVKDNKTNETIVFDYQQKDFINFILSLSKLVNNA